MAGGAMTQEDAAAPDLDVVGMSADREDHLAPGGTAFALTDQQVFDLRDQRLGLDRLGHVIVGTGPDRLDCVLELSLPADDQGGDLGTLGAGDPQELQTVHAGQLDVGDDQVPVRAGEARQRLLRAGSPNHVGERPQKAAQDVGQQIVVLDEEDRGLGAGAWHPFVCSAPTAATLN